MLHRLGLRPRGDDLLVAGRFGGLLAPHFFRFGDELGFLHLFGFELECVAHLFGFELFGEQFFHAGTVVGGQVDLAHLHRAQHDAVGAELGFQLGLDRLLDFSALAGENFTHGVAREDLVDDASHRRLDDIGVQVVRQVPRHRGDLGGVERVAHRQIDADRQPFDRLERRLAVGLGALRGVIDLITQHQAAHLVQPRQYPHTAFAELVHRSGELVAAHTDLAALDALHRRVVHDRVAHDDHARDDERRDDDAARGRRGEGVADGLHDDAQMLRHDSNPSSVVVLPRLLKRPGCAHCRDSE